MIIIYDLYRIEIEQKNSNMTLFFANLGSKQNQNKSFWRLRIGTFCQADGKKI